MKRVVTATAIVLFGSPAGAQTQLTFVALAPDVVRVDFQIGSGHEMPTEMMDSRGLRSARPIRTPKDNVLDTGAFRVTRSQTSMSFADMSGKTLLTLDLNSLGRGAVKLDYGSPEPFYGMRANALFGKQDPRTSLETGLIRNGGAEVSASAQGDGGAPLAYTKDWGVLIDSVNGKFVVGDHNLEFSGGSRKTIEAYIVLGKPERTIEIANDLTGLPPMPPRWSLGFMNSQWGTTESEVTSIVDKYRQKQIPLDGFILDFDFKAWGEDNFGEFRWNSTSGPGNVSPNKFPNGANGKFAKEMLDRGVHVVGIMKPRILTQNVDLKPTQAAAEATAHNWWLPGKKPYKDYFSGRYADDLNFSDPSLRKWYWEHAKVLFDSGISGWWNDEADQGFDSLGFFHMQQSLYDGQTSVSNRRVWSINRNFYLGAQRFGFGTWSGDINTGFESMAAQRTRMLDIVNLGQSEWSMDSGGFQGHPSAENYARWIEFASMVPIMRVHNTFGEHRQPWVYGPVAEAAATSAIRLRYSLLPYLYSAQRNASLTGVGIVRPLNWEYGDDPNCVNNSDSWMVGDALLASPIVVQGQTTKNIYLPSGTWFDYFSGKRYLGSQSIYFPVDSQSWSDLPLFVRSGSIVATQTGSPQTTLTQTQDMNLDVWPDPGRVGKFDVYDDDGETVSYRRGAFFAQSISADQVPPAIRLKFAKPTGSYRTALKTYHLRVHAVVRTALWNGKPVNFTSDSSGLTSVDVPAGRSGTLELGA